MGESTERGRLATRVVGISEICRENPPDQPIALIFEALFSDPNEDIVLLVIVTIAGHHNSSLWAHCAQRGT